MDTNGRPYTFRLSWNDNNIVLINLSNVTLWQSNTSNDGITDSNAYFTINNNRNIVLYMTVIIQYYGNLNRLYSSQAQPLTIIMITTVLLYDLSLAVR